MSEIFSKNKILFASYLLIFSISLAWLFYMGKQEAHLHLTSLHFWFTDILIKMLTMFGDGIFMVILGLVLLFRRVRYGLVMICSFLTSAIAVQLLKRLVFPGCKRPVAWFHDMGIEIYRVSGVEYHSAFSFPSGHTTTAFAMFFGLAFFVNRKSYKVVFLLLAVITAYSRIYLSQHFLGDVLAGSVIGVITAVVMQTIFEKKQAAWLESDLLSIIRKKNG
jgi:membrane-associated phospholipid phosphatase